jgi:16S rRNA (cytosine1402-N4)-methyltransferase
VKQFLHERSGHTGLRSRHLPPDTASRRPPSFRLQFRGVKKPGDAEITANPRARSAKLRGAVRTAAPAWREKNHP